LFNTVNSPPVFVKVYRHHYALFYLFVIYCAFEKFVGLPVIYFKTVVMHLSETPGKPVWAVTATSAAISQYSGRGVKVAVLDTGMDMHHPDFAGRKINTRSFVPGEEVQDRNGHGTHCVGICCGNTDNANRRYGIAYNSEIFAGKVLNNTGLGTLQYVIDGIQWATDSGCKVICMPLSDYTCSGEQADDRLKAVVKAAGERGAICVTAAGNDSDRVGHIIKPVSNPVNTSSVLTVAALDADLEIACFSNRGGMETACIDIAAPGVDIYSCWPLPMRYNVQSGTSMAASYVAGILALLFEKHPDFSPGQILKQLFGLSRKLPIPAVDAGSGLVMAP
jgi:subtilisin family serine protease